MREGRESNLVLFCVDASGSMAARTRMEQVKTAILSLLLDAYRRRDTVGLVTFRGSGAEVALPPTSSVDIAATRLAQLPAGGRTPLAEGLLEAAEVVRRERVRDPLRRALVVVVTDGRATHGPDALARSRAAAAGLASMGTTSVVVDCETGRFRMGLAAELAEHLGAEHVPLGEVTAEGLTDTVRARTHARAGSAHGPNADAPAGSAHASHRTRPTSLSLPKRGGLMPKGQPTTVPDDGLSTRQRRNRPLVMVHTGPGKGKSTAAFGLAMRAWNQGWDIGVFQFVKSAKWKIGEQNVMERLGRLHAETGEGGPVEWHKMGSGWSWSRKAGTEEDHAADAAEGWAEIKRRIAAQRHDLYLLDEFTYPIKWGWIDPEDVAQTLASRPGRQHVVITGRDADPALIEVADLVTEMGKIKHPMDSGQKGQRGIEW